MKKKIIALGLSAILAVSISGSAMADELSDLQNEQAYTEAQLADVNSSIDDLQSLKSDILGKIDDTDAQLVLTIASIDSLNTQIDEKNLQIAQTTSDLATAQDRESTEYNAMKKRIQYLYEIGGNAGWATLLLEENDITNLLTQAEYTQKMYEYDRNCLTEYAATVSEISNLKAQQEQEAYELQLMLANQQEQEEYLQESLENLKATSSDYDNEIANAYSLAAQYTSIINQQNSLINSILEEQERERQAAAEAAAAAAAAAAAQDATVTQTDDGNVEVTYTDDSGNTVTQTVDAEAYYDDSSSSGSSSDSSSSDPSYDASTGNAVVDRAYAWLGRAEYVWGACSPGAFDCSGFVSYCLTGSYSRIGTAASFMSGGTPVSNPQPGDVCASDHHCGIYIGDGQMIHCSTYGVGVIIGPVQSDMIIVRY